MAQEARRYSYDEYLALERESETKHEFIDGLILAMAGGSRRHNALAARVTAALENGRRAGCVTFQSDQKVRVLATGRATYPDVSVVGGPLEGDPADASGATITNPTVLVEVVSPSSEKDDRVGKWRHYQRIPSLQEYVLVSQDERRIERYRRVDDGTWQYTNVTDGEVELAAGGVLDFGRLYDALPES